MTDHHDSAPDAARLGHVQVEDIANALREDIIFGRLAPGTRLVEDHLMARFSASRHFTRQALYELERLGVAVREKNKGVSVRMLTPDEVRQIYEVREMLQRQAALLIPLPASAALIDTLEQIEARYVKALRKRDFSALHEANDAFHVVLFSACGNRYLVESIQHYMLLSLPVRATKTTDIAHAQQSARHHSIMIQMLKGSDNWALAQLCVDHLQGAKHDYLRDRDVVQPAPLARYS
jgi:DNA-binding GntR family transcriptional regulator